MSPRRALSASQKQSRITSNLETAWRPNATEGDSRALGRGAHCGDKSLPRLTRSATGSPISTRVKTGRNDPCPCGSGRKYKKCCLNKPKARR
jgi:SEC-C motif